jgi:hypothetical protein
MSAYRVIDKMELVVREGIWLPFGWRAVHGEQVLDLIEKLRSTLPGAARARKTDGADRDVLDNQPVDTRSTATNSIDSRSIETRSSAATDAAHEREVISRAQSRADTIVADAQAAARDIRRGADEYADQVLASLDTSLAKALAAVQKGRQTLASSTTSVNGKSREMSSL